MKKHLRIAITGAFLVAVAVVTFSAMAFAGRDTSGVKPSGSAKARAPAALAEQIRVDRRDSYSRTGCSKRVRPVHAPDV